MKILFALLAVFQITVIYGQQNKIAITVDDLPFVSERHLDSTRKATNTLLENFKKNDIVVVGFVNESKLYHNLDEVNERIDLLELWLKYGNDLGNHTFSHPSLSNTSLKDYQTDFLKGEVVLQKLWSELDLSPTRYFRYPYLNTGSDSLKRIGFEKFLNEQDYINIPVTVDNADWLYNAVYIHALKNDRLKDAERVGNLYVKHMCEMVDYFDKVSNDLVSRSAAQILLMHANQINADYFDQVIDYLKNEDYKFITVEEALMDDIYSLEDGYIGREGFSWMHRWRITLDIKYRKEPEVHKWVMKKYDEL